MPYFNAIWEQDHIIAVPFFYAVEIPDLLYIHNFMKLWKLKQAIYEYEKLCMRKH